MIPQPPISKQSPLSYSPLARPVPPRFASPGALAAAQRIRLLLAADPECPDETLAAVIENISGMRQFLSAIRIEGETEETRMDYLAALLMELTTSLAEDDSWSDWSGRMTTLDDLLTGLCAAYRAAMDAAAEVEV